MFAATNITIKLYTQLIYKTGYTFALGASIIKKLVISSIKKKLYQYRVLSN